MTDLVTIWNMALANVGTRSSVASLTENSKEAITCGLYSDNVRRGVLSTAQWDFAEEYATLGLLKALPGTPENTSSQSPTWQTSYPSPPWLYEYAYPTDCVAVRSILPQMATNQTTPPFTTGQYIYTLGKQEKIASAWKRSSDKDAGGNDITTILTNQSQALICYTKDIINTQLWDDLFIELVAAILAKKCCIQLTGNENRFKSLDGLVNELTMQARMKDANEGLTVHEIMPDWLRVRGAIFSDYNYTGFSGIGIYQYE